MAEAIVAKISSPSETIFWDTELTGLGLRVWSSGKKVYIVQHRNKQTQKLHKVTLGASSTVELKHARELASKHIYECNAELLVNGVKTITLKDMAQLYLKERYGKKKSLDQDEYKIKKYIIPALGSRLVKSITRQDVIDLQSKIFPYMVTANRVLDTLSSLFKFALDMNFAKENPVAKVKKYPEHKKEAYLSLGGINRLWNELGVYETHYPRSLYVINAIRLLMLTGARLREILN